MLRRLVFGICLSLISGNIFSSASGGENTPSRKNKRNNCRRVLANLKVEGVHRDLTIEEAISWLKDPENCEHLKPFVLGAGQFGKVLAATQGKARIVLKAIGPSEDETFEMQKKHIINECELMSELSHPNILSCKFYFHKDNFHLIALPRLDGKDLFDQISEKALTLNKIARYAVTMISAVQHVHACRIIHRDIKPENYMGDGDRLVLIDFGLSKKLPASGRTFSCCGSLGHMPHEMFTEEGYGCEVDWFALGATLFLMNKKEELIVCGWPVTTDAYFKKISVFKPDDMAARFPNPSENEKLFVAFLTRLLQVDPKKRAEAVRGIENDPFLKIR